MATARLLSNYIPIIPRSIDNKAAKFLKEKIKHDSSSIIRYPSPPSPPIPNFNSITNKYFKKYEMSESHSPRPLIRNIRS